MMAKPAELAELKCGPCHAGASPILASRPRTCYLHAMIKTFAYPLTIEPRPDEGGYLAYFPTLPGCQTWGDTYEAAIHNAEEALAVYIETLTANGDPVPETATIDSPVSLGVIVRAETAAA